jgi:hypothetical protein
MRSRLLEELAQILEGLAERGGGVSRHAPRDLAA